MLGWAKNQSIAAGMRKPVVKAFVINHPRNHTGWLATQRVLRVCLKRGLIIKIRHFSQGRKKKIVSQQRNWRRRERAYVHRRITLFSRAIVDEKCIVQTSR